MTPALQQSTPEFIDATFQVGGPAEPPQESSRATTNFLPKELLPGLGIIPVQDKQQFVLYVSAK